MDVEILSRFQFAFTIMFHYIYPPLSIGLGLILVLIEGQYLYTKDPAFLRAAKFWTKVFALTFALGVATGIVMEFEFGTNWATYSRYVGDVFGSALAAEGIFAFFLESGFLAILLFGWNRVGPKMHFFATLMVCLGAHFSAIWIVVANSWMQTPAGFHVVGDGLLARAEITDFWQMVFNPSSVIRLLHTVIGAWLAGSFLVISVSAYYLLKKRDQDIALVSMKAALSVALISLLLQAVTGDASAKIAATHQPSKFAALEGVYETRKEAPLILFGLPDSETKTVKGALEVPNVLSILTYGDKNAEVMGLDRVEKKDWPNVPAVFLTYRLMLAMWALMVFFAVFAAVCFKRGTLEKRRGLLIGLGFSVLLPQIANQAGWVAAEMGRYPWIVYNLLRISDGLSKSVVASQVLSSIIMFGFIYALLFILFIYLLNDKIKHGPEGHDASQTHHFIQGAVSDGK